MPPPNNTTSADDVATNPLKENGRVLSGAGAPDDALGVDGDIYIDTDAGTITGPRAAGTWTGAAVWTAA